MSDRATDDLFYSGRFDEAADRLEKGLEKEKSGRDELLYVLDIGLSRFSAGQHEEAIKKFLLADQLAEIKDYTDLAAETTTLLTSDNIKHYKAEDHENVLISAYLAMAFALKSDFEGSLVEAKRVNRKLYMMITEGKRKYKQNAFARYLSAVLYEGRREYNDAYIDYKFTLDLMPDYPGLGKDLWRTAWHLKMKDEMDRWKSEFNLSTEDIEDAKRYSVKSGKGEIVILYENGLSPLKHPNPSWRSIPKFYARYNPVSFADVEVDGSTKGRTQLLMDIEKTAIEQLDEKYAGIIAKKVGGVVAKEVVGDQVGKMTDSPILGALTKVFLHASDEADCRSWHLLPRDLQIARIMVDPGSHRVRLRPNGAGGGREPLAEKTVDLKPGQQVFVHFRYSPRS